MALCRLEAKIISRSGGRSTVGAASYRTGKCATSAAAYRAGAELIDDRTGKTFDYTRKRGVLGAEIMLPADAPEWMRDRGQLWNAVEKAERRADAQLARDYILTLPHELDAEQRRTLTREFVRRQFVDKGYVADIAWHAPHGKGDERNHHAHVMVVMRRIEGNGFARTKERPPEGKHPAEHWKAELRNWREAWANTGADALAAAGFGIEAVRFRAGHLTLDKQREAALARGDLAWAEILDREAEPKQGPLATKIEQEGRESHAGNDRRAAQARNADRARLKEEHAQVSAEIIDLETRRLKGRGPMDIEALTEERLRMQLEREIAALKEAEQLKEDLRGFEQRRQQQAEEAQRTKRERDEQDRARAELGEVTDAHNRYAEALGENYSMADPYGSLAAAAMAEYAVFNRQQQQLKRDAAAEQDPDKRRLIELRREIEGCDYMQITSLRLAGISFVVSGRQDSESVRLDNERAEVYGKRAAELWKERAGLQGKIGEREAQEGRSQAGKQTDPKPRQADKPEEGVTREQRGTPNQPSEPDTEARQRAAQARWSQVVNRGTTQPQQGDDREEGSTREQRGATRQHSGPDNEARRLAAQARWSQVVNTGGTKPRQAEAETNEQDITRRQREETDRRAGLQPHETVEGKPQTKEGREQSTREEAQRRWSSLGQRTTEDTDKPRDTSRPGGRPGGRGGR